MKIRSMPLKERFLDKVNKNGPNGCWLWMASIGRNGYGRISARSGRMEDAHRISWKLFRRPIPKGAYILHHCDNKRCVNPNHLLLGTQSQNMKDAVKKGRVKPPSNARLTEDQVRQIRKEHEAGNITQASLERKYGMSRSAIYSIVHRITWKHI